MKKQMFALLVPLFVLSAGCSTTREYTYTFDQVKSALNERFDRHQWTAQSTEFSRVKESVPGTKISYDYYHWQTPETKAEFEINLSRLDANRCEVAVYATDYDSWWYKILNERTMQHSMQNALLQRLKTGKWPTIGYEPNPYYARGDRRNGKTAAVSGPVGTEAPVFGTSNTPPPFTAAPQSAVKTPPPASTNNPPQIGRAHV